MRGNTKTPKSNNSKKFDQFYTRDDIAEDCLGDAVNFLKSLGVDFETPFFLEPSAGEGAFIRALLKKGFHDFFACDIDPNFNGVIKKDFLKDSISPFLPNDREVIVIGNPPFGQRARLASEFINQSLLNANIVCFILPLQFQKYSAQNKIIKNARLIFDKKLAPDSFIYNNEPYEVRCCFQIWTTKKIGHDLRLRSTPITKHKDFEMWQYNNTKEAEKYFNKLEYGWDFAIPRQGYKDYSIRETEPEKMDRRTQWIFFKANNEAVLKRLLEIDYTALSRKNISIPGFGKADVIGEYERLFGAAIEQNPNEQQCAQSLLPIET